MNDAMSRAVRAAACLALLASCSSAPAAETPPTPEEAFVEMMRGEAPWHWGDRPQPWEGDVLVEDDRLRGHLVALGQGMCGEIEGIEPLDVAGYSAIYGTERAAYLQRAAVGSLCQQFAVGQMENDAFMADVRD